MRIQLMQCVMKMVFLLNNKPVDALALIVHRSAEQDVGKIWVKKLREFTRMNRKHFLTRFILDKVIPRQLFEVPIQAAVGRKVVARETLSAVRADVTAGLYGGMLHFFSSDSLPGQLMRSIGHYERKMKHLVNQKESKRQMKRVGSVELPQEAFFDILRTKTS